MAAQSNAEHAATIGVYRPKNPPESLTVKFPAAKLPFGKYGWIDVGEPFIPQDEDYVWFAATPDCGIAWLYVDRIELVPVQ